MKKIYYIIFVFLFVLGSCALGNKTSNGIKTSKHNVAEIIRKVNNHWQKLHSPEQNPSWDWAAYQTGNMAAYQVTGDENYRNYARKWAEYNHWMGATSQNKKEWKYAYGTSEDYVLFGDWQACFQV